MRRSGRIGRIYAAIDYVKQGVDGHIAGEPGSVVAEALTRRPRANEAYAKSIVVESSGQSEVTTLIEAAPRFYAEFTEHATRIPHFEFTIETKLTRPTEAEIKIGQGLTMVTSMVNEFDRVLLRGPSIATRILAGFPALIKFLTGYFNVDTKVVFSKQIRFTPGVIKTNTVTSFPCIIPVGGKQSSRSDNAVRPRPYFETETIHYPLFISFINIRGEELVADTYISNITKVNILECHFTLTSYDLDTTIGLFISVQQEPGILEINAGGKIFAIVNPEERNGEIRLLRRLPWMALPDVRLEEPRFYFPGTNPARLTRFIYGTGRSNKGLFVKLSRMRDTVKNDWQAWKETPAWGLRPADATTPRGVGIRFDAASQTGIELKIPSGFYEDQDWSFFIYFYAQLPDQQGQRGLVVSKGSPLYLQWNGDPAGQISINQNLYPIVDDLEGGVVGSQKFFAFSLSSYRRDEQIKIYTDGNLRHTINQELVLPAYQGRVPLSFGRGSLLSNLGDRFSHWTGTILAYYEWNRILTDAEHSKVYNDPYSVYVPE